jgi:ABC-type transport system involved in multi-copper enzyme maturation permease subunit
MIATLLWKEYREQRLAAIALAVFAVALLISVQTFGEPSNDAEFPAFASLAVCLAWMAGLVAGSQTFAGEVENRTLLWLDAQPVLRRQVGRTKIMFATIFTLTLAALLLGLGIATRWIHEKYIVDTALYMLAAGLSGLGCAVLASAFAGSALNAIGLAFVFEALSIALWIALAQVFELFPQPRLLQSSEFGSAVVCVLLPFLIAQRRFTRLDRQRTPRRSARGTLDGHSWRALIWLAWRQTRTVCWFIAIAGLMVAILLPVGRTLPIWPAVGLSLGIIAGIGVFAADRPSDAYRFLGDRRLPYGRVWLVKSGMRLVLALLPAMLQLIGALIFTRIKLLDLSASRAHDVIDQFWSAITPEYLLLGPLYGFALGQFLGMICRKEIVAFILAIMISTLVLAAWWPSTVVGGVHLWQWIVPPLVLLGATWFLMRRWMASRLSEWQIALSTAGVALIAFMLLVAGVAYRVVEPPVRTAPFDVAAFEASLPTPEQNQAGRKLTELFRRVREEIVDKPAAAVHSADGSLVPRWDLRAAEVVASAVWPADDVELNRKLDEFAAGRWLDELRAATALPLGRIEFSAGQSDVEDSKRVYAATTLGRVLAARARQLAARGDSEGSLNALFLALDLGRHLQSKASRDVYINGCWVERLALSVIEPFAESAMTKPELLASALNRLLLHNRAVPPFTETLKLDYLAALRSDGRGFRHGIAGDEFHLNQFALGAPWEWSRANGILDTLFAGFLRTAALPYPQAMSRIDAARAIPRGGWDLLGRCWTPPPGPDADARAAYLQITELVQHSIWQNGHVYEWQVFVQEIANRTSRNAAVLQLALAQNELRHGKPAAELAELVPEFLSELPNDPFTDKPFRYRVSKGGKIDWSPYSIDPASRYRETPGGQGILWSVGGDMVDGGGIVNGASWWRTDNERPERDLIYLVPLVKK